MGKQRDTTEAIIHKLREADVLIGQGQTIAQVTKQRGVTEQTYFRWRKSHGGLRIEQAKRLRELAAQNARLKRAVADLTVDKLILQRSRRGNYSARVRCREAVALVRAKHAYSERRICRALGIARSVVRYVPQPRADEPPLRQSRSLPSPRSMGAMGIGRSRGFCGSRAGRSAANGWSGSGSRRG